MGWWWDVFVCVSVIFLCMLGIHVCAFMYICVYFVPQVGLLALVCTVVCLHTYPSLILYNVNEVVLLILQAHVLHVHLYACMCMHHVSPALPGLVVSSNSDRLQSSLILCRSAAASLASSWRVEASDCSLLGVVSRRRARHTTPPPYYQTWGNTRHYFLPLSVSQGTLWHEILFCGWGETSPKNFCIFPHKCALWWRAWQLSMFADLVWENLGLLALKNPQD